MSGIKSYWRGEYKIASYVEEQQMNEKQFKTIYEYLLACSNIANVSPDYDAYAGTRAIDRILKENADE